MQSGFYFDQPRGAGCFTYVAACKDWHDIISKPSTMFKNV